MAYSSFLCSAYMIVSMTFERFYSIIRPHKAASFNKVKRARITIVCVFIFTFSYCIPFLFIAENNAGYCTIRDAYGNILGELYFWLSETLGIVVPFVSLLTMNSVIIHALRQRSNLSVTGSEGQGQTEGQFSKIKQNEKQIFIMLLLVTFTFLILNIPVDILFFYMNFYTGTTPYYHAAIHFFYQLAQMIYRTNHGINFFLYVISGQKFRTDLKDLFISCKTGSNKRMTLERKTLSIPEHSTNTRKHISKIEICD